MNLFEPWTAATFLSPEAKMMLRQELARFPLDQFPHPQYLFAIRDGVTGKQYRLTRAEAEQAIHDPTRS